jgi:hypothetical protein
VAGVALGEVAALAPRVVVWSNLRARYLDGQAELVVRQRQVQQLERVVNALERDPQFAAELARVELGASAAGSERIAVPAALGFDPRTPRAEPTEVVVRTPWYVPWAELVATNATLRVRLLVASGVLVVAAFVLLQGGVVDAVMDGARSGRWIVRVLLRRYLREP